MPYVANSPRAEPGVPWQRLVEASEPKCVLCDDAVAPGVQTCPICVTDALVLAARRKAAWQRKEKQSNGRLVALPEYTELAKILDDALAQAQSGKGKERHAGEGERFEDQQIVQLGEWLGTSGSNHGAIFQACKKAIESTRLPDDRAELELLGAINYLAAAIIVIRRRRGQV